MGIIQKLLLEFGAALLAAGVPKQVAELIAAGLKEMLIEIRRLRLGPTEAGVVMEIIKTIDADPAYTGVPGTLKRVVVEDAVRQYLENHGKDCSQKSIDTFIQLGYNAMKAAG